MLAGIHRFIEDNHMITGGEHVLLAVSGGIDSMVMAHLFLHMPFHAGIAHCNFSLRGTESDGDEELVSSFCSENRLQFHSVKFDTRSYAHAHRISIQMAARELRYRWFEEIRTQYNYDHIAVAHNLNDNIETLLINLTRGTGLAGLCGMKPVSGNIIRPLLFATREKIVDYQKQHSINYREDSSNPDTKYARNKIRHLVIPVLREINPSIEHTLSETAARFSDMDWIIVKTINEIRTKVSFIKDEAVIFDLKELQEYTSNSTILFELFRPYGINNRMLNDILNVIAGQTGGQLFSDSHRIVKDRNHLVITELPEAEPGKEIRIDDIRGFENSDVFSAVQLAEKSELAEIPRENSTACLDADKIAFPVIIRKWKDGDFFYPLGMNGRKKLSDYFTDKKYSLPGKDKKLVLESDGRIIWIIGDRIDDRFKVTPETERVLILKV